MTCVRTCTVDALYKSWNYYYYYYCAIDFDLLGHDSYVVVILKVSVLLIEDIL